VGIRNLCAGRKALEGERFGCAHSNARRSNINVAINLVSILSVGDVAREFRWQVCGEEIAMSIRQKAVVLAGSSQGIGAAITNLFLNRGHKVAGTSQ
jgi:hypothetical protein